jgi:hypothetical protein
MTKGKYQADEKKSISLRETLSETRVTSFCKMFERAIFSSIQKRAGYAVKAPQMHNDTDPVTQADQPFEISEEFR